MESPFITAKESVLVVIDMQERLVPAVTQSASTIENIKRLLSLARILSIPVIFTEQEKLGATLPEIRRTASVFEPVAKIAFNCFYSGSFIERLGETGRTSLILTGVEAHICVAQTALWAHPRFRVHVVQDAVSSRSLHNVKIAVDRMRAAGITITSTEMAIYELLEKAGSQEFKAMLPLIK